MKKAVMVLVLFLFLSLTFALAEETANNNDITTDSSCNFGCKIWEFLFGNKEARAGKAWFDRSEPLVGEAGKQDFSITYIDEDGIQHSRIVPAETEESAKDAMYGWLAYNCQKCKIVSVDPPANAPAPIVQKPTAPEAAPKPAPVPAKKPASTSQPAPSTKPTATAVWNKNLGIWGDSDGKTYDKDGKLIPNVVYSSQSGEFGPAQGYIWENPASSDNFNVKKIIAPVTLNDVPTWDGEKTFPPGTVYKNKEGKYFIADEKGKGQKAVTEAQALQKLQENAAASAIDQNVQSQLQKSLGATYSQFEKSVGKVKAIYERPAAGTLVISGTGGEVIVDKAAPEGVSTATRLVNNEVIETYLVKGDQVLASQDAKTGNVKVGDASYTFPKGKLLTQSVADLKEGILLPGKEGQPSGLLLLADSNAPGGKKLIAADYDKETMQVVYDNGEKESLNIDYYQDGESECNNKNGCAVIDGGQGSYFDANGKLQPYLVDYDYDSQTPTGADRKLEDKELFNPITGRQEGTILPDGTSIIAQRGEKEYTGLFEVTDKDGNKGLITKDEKGNWIAAEQENAVGLNVAQNWLEIEENKKLADDRYSSTKGTLAQAQGALQSIYAVTNSIKAYPAISNLIFGKATFFKEWRSSIDKAFAPLLGSSWFPSAICENNELHWKDIEPEGKAVIKTISGTYQAVASIQMERSQEATPILCHKNPDEEADQQFICDRRQVCVKDQFCYADEDRDGDPDSKDPLKGYFYKITWAASAPRDEAFTPLRDENGVAVSFNIVLKKGEQATPIYNLNGNVASPIQLQNSASDRDVIIKYSTNLYDQACIIWNQAPMSINVAGRDGAAAGFSKIDNVCFSAVTSSIGEVNWQRSGQGSTSVSQKQGGVSKNTDW